MLSAKKKKKVNMWDDQCTNQVDGEIISQYTCIANHHIVYFK